MQAQLNPGATTNLGAGQVPANLTITAPSAGTFTVSVAGGPAVPYALESNRSQVMAINGAAVSIVNTTAARGAPLAGVLVLYW